MHHMLCRKGSFSEQDSKRDRKSLNIQTGRAGGCPIPGRDKPLLGTRLSSNSTTSVGLD